MDINNQREYWDRVANEKNFTHPINIDLLSSFITKDRLVVDFGCGYGRVVKLLLEAGYQNTKGYDTSEEMIKRGKIKEALPLYHIVTLSDLPFIEKSVDCILLFAVLTCIPSNKAQKELVDIIHSKLKSGGIIYVSDYYLQKHSPEASGYNYLDNNPDNFGVFNLPEGATFRHHTKEWIKTLFSNFTIVKKITLEVKTMNGHTAEAFQLILQK